MIPCLELNNEGRGVMSNRNLFKLLAAAALVASAPIAPVSADAISDFYTGRNVTVVIAAGPGGGHTKYTQLLAPYLKKHMPGHPNFVVQNMGGAGGTKAANYLYNRAAQDGSAIGILLSDTPAASRLRTTGVKYVANDFHFLGGADGPRSAFVVWKSAGVNSLADVRKKQVILGSTGKGSQTFVLPTLANKMLGTKFKVITGYRGMGGIYLAMDQKEVQGFQSSWSAVGFLRPHWIKGNLVVPIAANAVDPIPGLPNVPLLKDLVTDPMHKKIAHLLGGNSIIGRGWLAPPRVPAERVAALRAAFKKALHDPDVIADAGKRRMDWNPVPWQRMQAHAKLISETDNSLFVTMRKMLKK
jgi:tripartite-type tricarboxylate transporter receptor subunit TctC